MTKYIRLVLLYTAVFVVCFLVACLVVDVLMADTPGKKTFVLDPDFWENPSMDDVLFLFLHNLLFCGIWFAAPHLILYILRILYPGYRLSHSSLKFSLFYLIEIFILGGICIWTCYDLLYQFGLPSLLAAFQAFIAPHGYAEILAISMTFGLGVIAGEWAANEKGIYPGRIIPLFICILILLGVAAYLESYVTPVAIASFLSGRL